MLAHAPHGTGIRVTRTATGEFRRREPDPHSVNYTPLREAIVEANKVGGDVNACPFGCEDEDLDERWYCHHLVGFTNDVKMGYEPLVLCPDGRRRVKPRTIRRGKRTITLFEPMRKGDHVEWLADQGWGWVYRQDVPAPPKPEDPDDDDDDTNTGTDDDDPE